MKINKNKTILVWRWDDAPDEFRTLSQHGVDEDWIAFVPWEVWNASGRDLSNIRWLNSRGLVALKSRCTIARTERESCLLGRIVDYGRGRESPWGVSQCFELIREVM